MAPEGKYIEKAYHKIANDRGKHVCDVCCGTCCAATRHLIHSLLDIGDLRPDLKVKGCIYIKFYVILV